MEGAEERVPHIVEDAPEARRAPGHELALRPGEDVKRRVPEPDVPEDEDDVERRPTRDPIEVKDPVPREIVGERDIVRQRDREPDGVWTKDDVPQLKDSLEP